MAMNTTPHYLDTSDGKIKQQTGTGGSPNVTTKGGTTDYGNYPQNSILPFTGAAGAAENDILYTSGDVSNYSYHAIENESGVVIDIFVSVDGTNFSTVAASVLLVDDVTTGGGINVISIADNKVGILRGKFKKIRIDQAAAGSIAAGTVRGFHGVE